MFVPTFEKMSEKINIISPANRPKDSGENECQMNVMIGGKKMILFKTLKEINHYSKTSIIAA